MAKALKALTAVAFVSAASILSSAPTTAIGHVKPTNKALLNEQITFSLVYIFDQNCNFIVKGETLRPLMGIRPDLFKNTVGENMRDVLVHALHKQLACAKEGTQNVLVSFNGENIWMGDYEIKDINLEFRFDADKLRLFLKPVSAPAP